MISLLLAAAALAQDPADEQQQPLDTEQPASDTGVEKVAKLQALEAQVERQVQEVDKLIQLLLDSTPATASQAADTRFVGPLPAQTPTEPAKAPVEPVAARQQHAAEEE